MADRPLVLANKALTICMPTYVLPVPGGPCMSASSLVRAAYHQQHTGQQCILIWVAMDTLAQPEQEQGHMPKQLVVKKVSTKQQ